MAGQNARIRPLARHAAGWLTDRQQGRWGEAQQQYFKAFSAEPENADFAYNLAVSLDHIGQPKLALDYYRRALALAPKAGASFNLEAARSRATQLAR